MTSEKKNRRGLIISTVGLALVILGVLLVAFVFNSSSEDEPTQWFETIIPWLLIGVGGVMVVIDTLFLGRKQEK